MKLIKAVYFVLFVIFMANSAYADGFIIPDPDIHPMPINESPISVKYHNVKVQINDQATKTEIDQVFKNLSNRDIEGKYMFPLPTDAVLSDFAMIVKGEKIKGSILNKEEARQIYENIVSKLKDPALLEYVGDNLFQARVYPIPAKGEVPVIVSYAQILTQKNGVIKYVYPLNTEKFSAEKLEEVKISVNIESKLPIKSIYSPSHKIEIERETDHKAKVTYKAEYVKPDKDFVLIYTVSSDDFGVSLLTNREKGQDGFFSLLITPKYEIMQKEIQAKNIVFVLDTSGSMSGDKIVQAKEALEFVINSLNKEDMYKIISFSDDINVLNSSFTQVDSESKSKALEYIKKLSATGGTNINKALLTALQGVEKNGKPNIVIFLTDGEATVGVQDTDKILDNVKSANIEKTRIFVFGVGNDVNTHLLDKLAEGNSGVSEYVRPDENIEVSVSNFFKKISYPLLSEIDVNIPNVEIYDVYPKKLPDIFKGSQLLVFGRYKKAGASLITLSGNVEKTDKTFEYSVDFPGINNDNDFLPQLWAARKIGYLLDTIRLEGKSDELVEEVIKISKKYGIITPYTSYLVNPDADEEYADSAMEALSSAPVSGRGAVDTTLKLKAFKGQEQILDQSDEEYNGKKLGDVVRQFDVGAFILNQDDVWVDSSYNEGDKTIKIKLFSKEYFELLNKTPKAGDFMSLGKKVIFKLDDKFYEITE